MIANNVVQRVNAKVLTRMGQDFQSAIRLLRWTSFIDGPVVHEADGDRPTGDRLGHAVTEIERRATGERGAYCVVIDVAGRSGVSWLA